MAQPEKKKSKKGGAPRKPEDEKIAPVISVYFNRKQYRMLEDYMSKNNLVINKKSGLIKEIVLQNISEKKILLMKQNDPKLIFEVNKIGININQLTKKLNSLDALSGADLDRLRKLTMKMSDFISQA